MRRIAVALTLVISAALPALAQDGPVVVVPVQADDPAVVALAEAAAPLMDVALRGRSARYEPGLSATLVACGDPACVGAAIGASGAIAALVVRRDATSQAIQIDLLSAGAGVPITVGLRSELSGDMAADIAQVLNTATIRRLAGTIAPPPVRSALLVTTNVRGAAISIDGQPAGEAPARAFPITLGEHTVTVASPGFGAFNRQVTVTPEGARVNALLEPTDANAEALAADDASTTFSTASGDEPVTKKWWFWAAVGGGALVVAGVIAAIAVASGGDDGPTVVGVPPIPGGR